MNSDFFLRHSRIALFFSAGKDSAACLKLLEPYWQKFDVVWCNSGDAYPETIEYMREIRARVPRFVELHGNQPEFIRKNGNPVDLIPVTSPAERPGFVPFMSCCSENLWKPTAKYLVDNHITGVIKGQKLADTHRATANHNERLGGMEIWHPLEHWTDAQVFEFLGKNVPAPYARGHRTSLDCMTCTAFLSENGPRIKELKTTHPEKYAFVRDVLARWKLTVSPTISVIDGVLS